MDAFNWNNDVVFAANVTFAQAEKFSFRLQRAYNAKMTVSEAAQKLVEWVKAGK